MKLYICGICGATCAGESEQGICLHIGEFHKQHPGNWKKCFETVELLTKDHLADHGARMGKMESWEISTLKHRVDSLESNYGCNLRRRITELERRFNAFTPAQPEPPKFEGFEWVRKGIPIIFDYVLSSSSGKIFRTYMNWLECPENIRDIYRIIGFKCIDCGKITNIVTNERCEECHRNRKLPPTPENDGQAKDDLWFAVEIAVGHRISKNPTIFIDAAMGAWFEYLSKTELGIAYNSHIRCHPGAVEPNERWSAYIGERDHTNDNSGHWKFAKTAPLAICAAIREHARGKG